MIGKLQGLVDFCGEGFVIIMTGGVGYKVYCPEHLTVGDNVKLWIETVVREDSIRLFGFTTIEAQELFNQLTSVSGLGPKGAISILSTLKTDVLISAIATGDIKTITAAPGVGKKVAEKIILEMKGKVAGISVAIAGASDITNDLLSALESLGYRRVDIVETVQNLVKENPNTTIEKLVPIALKHITK